MLEIAKQKKGETKLELSIEVKALEVHNRAKSYYAIAEQYTYKFLMELKEIRDNLLFMQLGCETFEEYCMEFYGLENQYVKERIIIATEGGETFYNGSYQKLGHKKSLLIFRQPDPSVYLENEETYNLSYAKLKEKIKNDLKAEIEEEERKLELERLKAKIKEYNEQIYEKAKKVCTLCYHHKPLDDTPKNNKIFIKIGHLLYDKYILPNDEESKASRKEALIRIAEWYNIRLLLADLRKHKKLYETDEDYREFIDALYKEK